MTTTLSNHEREAPVTADKATPDTAVLFTDGASKGNPGPAGAGFVLTIGGEACVERAIPLGVTTVGVAEYRALIAGLAEAAACGVRAIQVYTDSEFMAQQMLGIYKVRTPAIRPLFDWACKLRGRFEKFEIQHVPRGLNNLADGLATEGAKASARGEKVELEG
jgi:ribonuclease HI